LCFCVVRAKAVLDDLLFGRVVVGADCFKNCECHVVLLLTQRKKKNQMEEHKAGAPTDVPGLDGAEMEDVGRV